MLSYRLEILLSKNGFSSPNLDSSIYNGWFNSFAYSLITLFPLNSCSLQYYNFPVSKNPSNCLSLPFYYGLSLWLMAKNENGIKMNVIAIQIPLWAVFQPLFASYAPSPSCHKKFWQKGSLIWFYQGLNPLPCRCQLNTQPFNKFMFCDD